MTCLGCRNRSVEVPIKAFAQLAIHSLQNLRVLVITFIDITQEFVLFLFHLFPPDLDIDIFAPKNVSPGGDAPSVVRPVHGFDGGLCFDVGLRRHGDTARNGTTVWRHMNQLANDHSTNQHENDNQHINQPKYLENLDHFLR